MTGAGWLRGTAEVRDGKMGWRDGSCDGPGVVLPKKFLIITSKVHENLW